MANLQYIKQIDNLFILKLSRQLRAWMPMGNGMRMSKRYDAYVRDEQLRPIKDIAVLVNCCIAEDEAFRLLENLRRAFLADSGAVWNTQYSVASWNSEGVGRVKGCTFNNFPTAGRSVYQHDELPASLDGLCAALKTSLRDVEVVIIMADGNNVLVGDGYKAFNNLLLVAPPYVEKTKASELWGENPRFSKIPLIKLRPLPSSAVGSSSTANSVPNNVSNNTPEKQDGGGS